MLQPRGTHVTRFCVVVKPGVCGCPALRLACQRSSLRPSRLGHPTYWQWSRDLCTGVRSIRLWCTQFRRSLCCACYYRRVKRRFSTVCCVSDGNESRVKVNIRSSYREPLWFESQNHIGGLFVTPQQVWLVFVKPCYRNRKLGTHFRKL